jgi:hypothetical protein
METKLSKLKAAWHGGDQIGALRIAAQFPRLGDAKKAITQAWAAVQNPAFYRQLGRDPEQLVNDGLQPLAARYEL